MVPDLKPTITLILTLKLLPLPPTFSAISSSSCCSRRASPSPCLSSSILSILTWKGEHVSSIWCGQTEDYIMRFLDVTYMRRNRGYWNDPQPPVIKPRTPGMCCQCSATELWQPDNHQPSQSSQYVVLKCLSHTCELKKSIQNGIRTIYYSVQFWDQSVYR